MALLRHGLHDLKTMDAERERQRLRAAARRLEKKGFLEKIARDDKRAWAITEMGKAYIDRHQNPKTLEDGTLTIVSFDIPEQYKLSRQSLRRFLKSLGFTRHHLSVWTSDKDWADILSQKAKELQIDPWVVVLQGKILS